MKYIEAPEYNVEIARLPKDRNLFLAGSITGALDWQKSLAFMGVYGTVRLLDHFNCFNPRRANYDTLDPKMEQEQITWEYHNIQNCESILFWFSKETLAPITLFELGSALHTHDHKRISIGIDPEYKRKSDVLTQVRLRNPYLAKRIVYSLEELAQTVLDNRIYHNPL